ncbi:flagellar protein FliT [Lysinibacillus sp. OL1_EC]|uniref:flagellar protein FliT n=1 Tax=unclassified Lysinibacillus TaxID=2636778 RepID=UPI00103E5439|nr:MULTISPECIES: flagellar protein FliT [unclassified Lysinibacillus]MCM0626394.1 flagellar protein FliT [Lysinibacillus sp. OL1_EC]TBV85738.1 flagellar protein FliT [Lysinibacillus sp. OL1]
MQLVEQLLQVSTNLYKVLDDTLISEERDEYIAQIHELLDQRKIIIEMLVQQEGGFRFDKQNRIHCKLLELDNGIKERLEIVINSIKKDLTNLQKAKKNESQYYNPFASVRVMDGMYYDKKN